MSNTTRAEHMQWCKRRALEYVDAGQLQNAVGSMLSDLNKHPETRKLMDGPGAMLAMAGMMDAQSGDPQKVRDWIEGFAE